jgi:hypothetical protein
VGNRLVMGTSETEAVNRKCKVKNLAIHSQLGRGGGTDGGKEGSWHHSLSTQVSLSIYKDDFSSGLTIILRCKACGYYFSLLLGWGGGRGGKKHIYIIRSVGDEAEKALHC